MIITRLIGCRLLMVILAVSALVACGQSTWTDHRGQTVSLTSDQGQWLLLNVWAQWCGPCRDEVPELNALAAEGQVRVIGLDFDGDQGDALVNKVSDLDIKFPVLVQSPLEALKEKSPQVLPATLIISPEGKVVDRLYGPQTRESLEARLMALKGNS